jgi:hypothetical protein
MMKVVKRLKQGISDWWKKIGPNGHTWVGVIAMVIVIPALIYFFKIRESPNIIILSNIVVGDIEENLTAMGSEFDELGIIHKGRYIAHFNENGEILIWNSEYDAHRHLKINDYLPTRATPQNVIDVLEKHNDYDRVEKTSETFYPKYVNDLSDIHIFYPKYEVIYHWSVPSSGAGSIKIRESQEVYYE